MADGTRCTNQEGPSGHNAHHSLDSRCPLPHEPAQTFGPHFSPPKHAQFPSNNSDNLVCWGGPSTSNTTHFSYGTNCAAQRDILIRGFVYRGFVATPLRDLAFWLGRAPRLSINVRLEVRELGLVSIPEKSEVFSFFLLIFLNSLHHYVVANAPATPQEQTYSSHM